MVAGCRNDGDVEVRLRREVVEQQGARDSRARRHLVERQLVDRTFLQQVPSDVDELGTTGVGAHARGGRGDSAHRLRRSDHQTLPSRPRTPAG